MLLGDAAIFFASLYLALLVRNLELPSVGLYREHVEAFLLLFLVYELVMYIAGFWSRQVIPTAKNIFEILMPAHAMATIIMIIYFYLLPNIAGITPKTNLLIFTIILLVFMYAWKVVGLRLFTLYPIRAVLVGNAPAVEHALRTQPLWNIDIVEHLSSRAGLDDIEHALETYRAETIIVDLDRYPRIDILYKLMFANVTIVDCVSLREEIKLSIDLDRVDHDWFLAHITQRSSVYLFLKRACDVGAGIVLALVTIVLFPCIALAIRLEDRGPVFIKQQRVGMRGQEFAFYKFRTMSVDGTNWRNKDKSVTRVGRVLRSTRMDELAQCLNLIRGDISLVGPRAILVNEHQTMVKRNPFQQARLLAQPGLTGWAQVQQAHAPANEQEALERLAYDLYYIKNISLWLDIKIILKTIRKLLARAGMRS